MLPARPLLTRRTHRRNRRRVRRRASGRSVYNYFRDYDPVTGRYAQSDPIGLAGGLNPYLYANGNPLRYADPYGLLSFSDATDAVFGAVWYATDGWSPSQGLVDFSAGWGDELSFGITRQLRDLGGIGAVNRCSWSYAGGEAFGFVNGLAFAWAKGTKAAAVADSGWSNFSHTALPQRTLKRWNNSFARWLNRRGNRLNGDFVTPQLHTRMDAAAQFGLTAAWRRANPLFFPARQMWNRVPYVPGAALYAAGSAYMNSCECSQ